MDEEHLDIGGCEGRVFVEEALVGEEEHGQHDERGVMVPAAHLVFPEAALLLGVLQRALDEVALPPHVDETLGRGLGTGIGQPEL